MERLLETYTRDDQTVLSVNINDIGGGGATLYLSNGTTRLPTALLGDFEYNLPASTFNIYHLDGWRTVTVGEVESLVLHPNGNRSAVAFTVGALPYWVPVEPGQERIRSRFPSVKDLLSHFRRTFDVKKITLVKLPGAHSEFGLMSLPRIPWSS